MIPLISGIPSIACLQLAVAALPGYRQALDLATEAEQWLKRQPTLPTVDPALKAHVSDKWVDAERARQTALAEYEARRRIVQTRLLEEANRAQSILNTGVDLVLGALQGNLAQLLGDVERLIADLDGAATPEQAIAADAGPTWRQLTELAHEYQDIRAAQTFIMMRAPYQVWKSCTPSLPGEDHANLCFIRNLPELWPDWRQPGLRVQRINLSDRATPHRDEPWPADAGPELLVWATTSGAELWCPTTRQLRELFAELNAPAPVDDAPEEEQRDPRDSLLYGPLEAERKRQAAAAQKKRQPDYGRVATRITSKQMPQPAEIGADK